jgi:hypothetical protein
MGCTDNSVMNNTRKTFAEVLVELRDRGHSREGRKNLGLLGGSKLPKEKQALSEFATQEGSETTNSDPFGLDALIGLGSIPSRSPDEARSEIESSAPRNHSSAVLELTESAGVLGPSQNPPANSASAKRVHVRQGLLAVFALAGLFAAWKSLQNADYFGELWVPQRERPTASNMTDDDGAKTIKPLVHNSIKHEGPESAQSDPDQARLAVRVPTVAPAENANDQPPETKIAGQSQLQIRSVGHEQAKAPEPVSAGVMASAFSNPVTDFRRGEVIPLPRARPRAFRRNLRDR